MPRKPPPADLIREEPQRPTDLAPDRADVLPPGTTPGSENRLGRLLMTGRRCVPCDAHRVSPAPGPE